ncbi:hypothetical protein STEG23_009110, partial [Scotinomys teguina]
KKKSKFKAFKNFFGKKKKKESEGVPERKVQKQRFSSSSLKSVRKAQLIDHRPKSTMGAKTISRDSVFCVEPERKISTSKLHTSPDPQRGRPQKRSPISRSLSKVTGTDVFGASMGSEGCYEPRSENFVSGFKISESISELSSDLDLSQSSQSSIQQSSEFSSLATSQGCLDSSVAKSKIALNPRKQKRKKTISLSAKEKHEEQYPLLMTEEMATTKLKQADQKEQKKDSTGPSSQEQSYKTETQDKKTREQTLSTDSASSTKHLTSGSHPRRRRRRAKNEWGIIERTLIQCTQEYDRGSKAESSPNEKLVGRDPSPLKLFLEKQSTKHLTTAEVHVTTPQEMSADKKNVKGEMVAINVEVQRTAAPQPTPKNEAESKVSGPSPSREEGSSDVRKKMDRAGLLSWSKKFSTDQEEPTVSRTIEVQACVHHSQVHGEKEEARSLGLQKFQPKMERTAYHQERCTRGSLQAFSANVSSDNTEDDVSIQKLPLPFRRKISNSKSSSEYESSCEVQPGPIHSFQLAWNRHNDDDDLLKTENVGRKLTKMNWKPHRGCCSQSFGKPKAREVSLDLDSSEDQGSCEEMLSAYSSQSLGKFQECSESKSFILDPISQEQLAPQRHCHALQESEEKEISTESSSYHSSEDFSSTDEGQPPECSKQTRGQFRDQQQVSPVSKSAPKELSVSAKPLCPMHTSLPIVSPVSQQQPSISMNISVGQNRSVMPLHTVKPWVSPQSEHQMFADPEGIPADRDMYIQSPSPRKALMHPMGYHVEQNVPSSPEISTMGEVASMEVLLPRHRSQAPIRPLIEQNVSAGLELAGFEEHIASQPPRYPSKPLMRPSIKKEISLDTESAPFAGSHFMEPLPPQHHSQSLLKPFSQHQASALERGVSTDPRLLAHPFQPWTKSQGKQSFSSPESTAFEGNPSMEHVPPTLSQPYQNVSLESKAVAAKIISMGPVHTKYSAQSLPNPQSQPATESTTLVELLPPQPSVKPKFQPQMTRDPVSTSTQWGNPVEPVSVQHIFETQARPKFKQVPTGLDSPEAQGSICMQPGSPRCPSQSWWAPTFEQISVPSSNVPAVWSIHSYPPAPRMPSQPLMVSVVQQPVSPGSMNTSVQQIITVEPVSPRHPLQPWATSPFEHLSSVSAAAKGTISQNTGSWSVPQSPDSPNKTTKYTQVHEDLIKSTRTSVTKPEKLTTLPAEKAFLSRGTHSKEEVPRGPDGNESPSIISTSKTDVKNVFGVRLQRISQKSGTEKLDPFKLVVPSSKEWMNKGASQGFSGSQGNFSQTLSFAEKQGNKPRYGDPLKKLAVYRPPGKTSNWKAHYTTEPAWINVAKERQRGFVSHFLKKTKSRAEAKEPRCESNYDPELEIPQKEHEPVADTLSRMTLSSATLRQERSRLYKSTKTVAFDDQNLPYPYISERETRHSSSLPPKFSPPEEPVWFEMAEKKAQAWSQMSETMR